MIPLPRMSIPLEELQKPIPALSERQYVVDKTKKTLEQVHAEREVFWFRERLLNTLSATWIEVSSRTWKIESPKLIYSDSPARDALAF